MPSSNHGRVGPAKGATPRLAQAEPCDGSDWAWEFLRRNPDYLADWRAAVPRRLSPITLHDGTPLLRLRRRYPKAENWGLYAFADPFSTARSSPVFWLPTMSRRVIRARCTPLGHRDGAPKMSLADFKVNRAAVIGVDGVPVVTLKGPSSYVLLKIYGLPALASPASVVFELDDLADIDGQTECLKTLQRFREDPAAVQRSPFANDERLRHVLIALDGALAGKTYRQIAIAIFGEKHVAEEWNGVSRFLKDRTRRLVAKGRELMQGGYRDLLG